MLERVGVHSSHSALELGVLSCVCNSLHGIQDQTTAVSITLHSLPRDAVTNLAFGDVY